MQARTTGREAGRQRLVGRQKCRQCGRLVETVRLEGLQRLASRQARLQAGTDWHAGSLTETGRN
jgi:hypothetical protein